MDKDLLKIAVEMAKTQILNNAIAASNNPATLPSLATKTSVEKLVLEYYDSLKKANSWFLFL